MGQKFWGGCTQTVHSKILAKFDKNRQFGPIVGVTGGAFWGAPSPKFFSRNERTYISSRTYQNIMIIPPNSLRGMVRVNFVPKNALSLGKNLDSGVKVPYRIGPPEISEEI